MLKSMWTREALLIEIAALQQMQSSIEILVGLTVLLGGLYLAFWTEQARKCLKEWSELPHHLLALIGNVMGVVGLILLYIGIRAILQ